MKSKNINDPLNAFDGDYMSSHIGDVVPKSTEVLIVGGIYGIHQHFYFYSQLEDLAARGFNALVLPIENSAQEKINLYKDNKIELTTYLNDELTMLEPVGLGEIITKAESLGQKVFCVGEDDNKPERSLEEVGKDLFEPVIQNGKDVDNIHALLIEDKNIKPIYFGVPHNALNAKYDKDGKCTADTVQSLFSVCNIKTYTVDFIDTPHEMPQNREILQRSTHDKAGYDTPNAVVNFP